MSLEHIDEHGHPRSGPERLLALSDGIFSVAMTLGVIDVMPPDLRHRIAAEGTKAVLLDLGPKFGWIVMTFLLVGFYWIAHHRIFHYVRSTDYRFLFINLMFLMCITFMPFAIEISAAPVRDRAAAVFYGLYIGVTGLLLNRIWAYATAHKLVDPHLDRKIVRYNYFRPLVSAGVFLGSTGVALWNPIAARYVWLILFFNRRISDYLAGGSPRD